MRRKNAYQLEPLRELADQQVRFVPREKKIIQALHAENLYQELLDTQLYSYRFVCAGITDFKAERYAGLMLEGKKIKHDLLLLIEDLFDSANAAADEFTEKVWTIPELCRRFNVSNKTISRWREQGLTARIFRFGAKKQVGFFDHSVEHFVQHHSIQVARSGQFRQLTAQEKRTIVAAARRSADTKPSNTAQRLARHLGRSTEAVRYTLKHFDEQNPDTAVFDRRRSLNRSEQEQIAEAYRNGTPVKTLTQTFHRTRSSIYRIVHSIRAKRIADLPLRCIEEPDFALNTTSNTASNTTSNTASNLTPDAPVFVEEPAGTAAAALDERFLFRRMNLLKFKAAALRKTLDRVQPAVGVMEQIETLYTEALSVKNEIVASHLPLVVSAAKRHAGQAAELADLISDGNLILLQAVETFDYRRGNRFSTYLTWAISRKFAQAISTQRRFRSRFVPDDAEQLANAPDKESGVSFDDDVLQEHRRQVGLLLNMLEERERNIIEKRFGLDGSDTPSGRKRVGAEVGLTAERVRQIEKAVMEKWTTQK